MARQRDDHYDDHLLGDAVDIDLFARWEAEAAIDNVFAPHDALPGAVLPVRGEHASAREAYASAAEKAYITTCDGETRKTARTQLVIATTETFAPNDPTVVASWIADHLARLDELYGDGVVLAAAVERRPDAVIMRAILLPSDVGLHAKRQFDPDHRVKVSKRRTKQQTTVAATVTPGEPAQVKPTRRKSIRIRLPIAKQPKPAAIATDTLVPHVIAASEKASDASLPVASVVTDGSPANTVSLGTSDTQSGGLGSLQRSDYATCCNDRRNDADQPSSRAGAPNPLRGHALRTTHRQEKEPIVSGGGPDRPRRHTKALGFRRGLPIIRELIEQQAGQITSTCFPNLGAMTDVDFNPARHSKIISRRRRPQQPPERMPSSTVIRSGYRLPSEKHERASKPLPSRAGLSDLAHTRHAPSGDYQSIKFRRGLTAGLAVGHRVCVRTLLRLALSRQNRSRAAALTSSLLLRCGLHRPTRTMQGGTDLRGAERVLRSTPRLPSRDLWGRTSRLSGGRPLLQVPITSSARRRPTGSGVLMFRAILAPAVLTLSSGLALAQQGVVPPWSASVMNSGTPGLQGIPAFLWNQSANPKAFDERPTLRIDREVQAGTGKPGYTYKALWVLGTTGYSSAGYEWTITGEQHNRTRGSTGAQNVAVNGTIWRDPTDSGEPSGPSWGLNGNCVDTTGEQPPTYGCIGAELDVGGAVGPDPHRQRVILHGAGGGQPGSHIGYGVMISPTPGTTIDRAFSTANVNGAFGIGLDLAGGVFGGAAILMGSGQFLALDGTPEGAFGHFLFYRDRTLTYMTPGGPTLRLDDDGAAHVGRIVEQIPHVPASANAPCIPGEHAWDHNYEYRCVAENRWRRAALSDW